VRYGIHVHTNHAAANAIDDLLDTARFCRSSGLDLYVPQLMDVDALTAVALAGRAAPGLTVGTAVVPTYPRHPFALASQALTAQAATHNNLVLGIGLSHQLVVETMFGLSYEKPVRHMREYLELLMPALRGEMVDVHGETLSGTSLQSGHVPGATPPPVLIAALGTQMLTLAGRATEGTALWMTGAKTVESHIVPTITRAAESAGRARPRVLMSLPVCVTHDVTKARETAAELYAMYGYLPSYRAMLDREGAAGPQDVAIVGDEDAVAAQLRGLEGIGVTDLALPVFGSEQEKQRSLALLAELARADVG
jgi:F420-dependent oxidoreductase-like protein